MIAGKSWIRNWINEHPAVWEFILFNVLSNVATIVNFIAMWICTGFLFVSLENIPFQFFVFHYTQVESDLGLGAAAQAVNFYVQKNFVFRSNAAFARAVPRYICLAVVLVIVSAALPAYSQAFFKSLGLPQALIPTLANGVNIVVQVVLSYPAMKFWIMPK